MFPSILRICHSIYKSIDTLVHCVEICGEFPTSLIVQEGDSPLICRYKETSVMTSGHKHFTMIFPTLTFVSSLPTFIAINLNEVLIAANKPCRYEVFSTSLIVCGYHKYRASLRRTHKLPPNTVHHSYIFLHTHLFYTTNLQLTSQFFYTK